MKRLATIVPRGAAHHPSRQRLPYVAFGCAALLTLTLGRLCWLGMEEPEGVRWRAKGDPAISASRPVIRDRNGVAMAMDIKMSSLFAEPRNIERPDETLAKLATVLPEIDTNRNARKLRSGKGFEWLKREVTPAQEAAIMDLGLPGIAFRKESRRLYPGGRVGAHILGHVNVDNQGIAGIEKHVDDSGLADLHKYGFAVSQTLEPLTLSVDMRVQHFVHEALVKAMDKYRAIAAAGVVLDVHSGEIVAMSSLPGFDPNRAAATLTKDSLNRMTAGVFEMGSTFKAFTTAMALDSGRVSLGSRFDARKPIRIGRHRINDFHGKRRVLSVPEVFIYSSNIGTAKMAETVGIEGHKAFLFKLGLLDRLEGFELPEVARPTSPTKWKQVHSITISYGHGATTTPLQTAVAAAALVNGGKLIPPTLMKRTRAEADAVASQVISPETSDEMRYLFRLNVLRGSGRRAEVPGFIVGGKTGTAEKVVDGRYSRDKRFNAFLSAFPMDDPRYVVLVILDEPKPEKGKRYATAGTNAAPTVREIVSRAAPVLGVRPRMEARDTSRVASYRRDF